MQPNMTLKNSHFSGPNPADAWKPLRPDFVRGRYAGRSGHELIEKQAESRKKPEFFATVRADANFLRSRWTRQILSLVRPVPFSIGGRRTPDDGCCRCATPIPPTVFHVIRTSRCLHGRRVRGSRVVAAAYAGARRVMQLPWWPVAREQDDRQRFARSA